MNDITGKKFKLFKTGGSGLLSVIIGITKLMAPGKDDLFPPWQGMQYMRDMIDDRASLPVTDNNRYQGLKWTTVKELLAAHQF